jgi:hypothetical protein
MQKPSVGAHVLYKLCASDIGQIDLHRAQIAHQHNGYVGNAPSIGQVFPAFVVADWSGGTYLNLHVMLDGYDTLWVTSRQQGDGEGQWSWPAAQDAE